MKYYESKVSIFLLVLFILTNSALSQTKAIKARGAGTYAYEDEDKVVFGNNFIEAVIGLSDNSHLKQITNKYTEKTFKCNQQYDSILRMSSSEQRIEIASWSFRPGSAEPVDPEKELGYRRGYHKVDCNSSDWARAGSGWGGADQINYFPVGDAMFQEIVYPGYGWYRTESSLPLGAKGKTIELGLGKENKVAVNLLGTVAAVLCFWRLGNYWQGEICQKKKYHIKLFLKKRSKKNHQKVDSYPFWKTEYLEKQHKTSSMLMVTVEFIIC